MDIQRIFLQENNDNSSVNLESNINVELSRKARLLPNENVYDTISLNTQYNKERDECTKFRVISTINPICTNILFNMKSEIMVNEGSEDCKVLFDGETTFSKKEYASEAINKANIITYEQSIIDTEYSHKNIGKYGPFIYHCGIDIFDNHMIRNDGFVHINKTINDGGTTEYNTIRDTIRNEDGSVIKEEIGVDYTKQKLSTTLHVYNSENLLSMKDAFLYRCKEKDGWWGFINPGNIEIPNNSKENVDICINKMMANNKSCEFIDLYPDRTLFSFVPKFNKARRRIEKNWDYCITYPYAKDKDKLNEICGGKNQSIRAFVKKTYNNSSTEIMQCSSYFKHNLKPNDYVYFYYYLDHVVNKDESNNGEDYKWGIYNSINGELMHIFNTKEEAEEYSKREPIGVPYTINKVLLEYQKFEIKTRVISVGNQNGEHKDRIFNVIFSDIDSVYDKFEKIGCFYKKIDNNIECDYYIRKFKKIKSLENDELKSDINKVAFSKNIYGDDLAQIIFLDDIDVEGIKDYNGKPITDIYLTIIKRNSGYEKFYSYDGTGTGGRQVGDKEVEFSHCFGKVSSGIDFSGIEEEPFDYNAHYLHNIDKSIINNPLYSSEGKSKAIKNTISAWGDTVLEVPKKIEDNITINNDEFYGDIVEFSYYNYKETLVGNIFHRFNTVQRESFDTVFMNIYHNVLEADDYDSVNGAGGTFKVTQCYLNHINNKNTPVNGSYPFENLLFGNIFPEGYVYNPHIKIQIRENDGDSKNAPGKFVNYDECQVDYVYNFRFAANPDKGYEKEETFIGSAIEETYVADGRAVISPKFPYTYSDAIYLRVKINVPFDYGFYRDDYIAFYNKENGDTIWGQIIKVEGWQITLSFDINTFNGLNENKIKEMMNPNMLTRIYYAFWSEFNVPTFAKFSMTTGNFYWRNIIPPSELIKDSPIFNTPFSNGRFYLHKNVNFFLRRQDPNGKYGLSYPLFKRSKRGVSNNMLKFSINGYDSIDLSKERTMIESVINTCM